MEGAMKTTWMPVALAVAAFALADDPTPEDLFHEGWYKETGQKDLEGAIAAYEKVVSRAKEAEAYAARAQFQIGVCLEKMGRAAEARKAFQKVVDGWPAQKEWADKAKERLAGAREEEETPEDPNEAVLDKMKRTKTSVNFTDAPLPDVLAFFREFSDLNLVLDVRVEKPEAKSVTFRVQDIEFDHVLDLVLKMLELDWCVDDGVIIVSTKEGIAARREARKKPVEPEADAAAWKAEMQRVLDTAKIDLDFTDATLEDIVGFFREYAQLNVEFDAKLREDGTCDRKMTLQLRNVSIGTAIKVVLDQVGLTTEMVNHVLLIRRPAEHH